VSGFAQSVEQAASLITAFLIGPPPKLLFIPFMTNGAGAGSVSLWFGTGTDRRPSFYSSSLAIIGLTPLLAMFFSHAKRRRHATTQTNKASQWRSGCLKERSDCRILWLGQRQALVWRALHRISLKFWKYLFAQASSRFVSKPAQP